MFSSRQLTIFDIFLNGAKKYVKLSSKIIYLKSLGNSQESNLIAYEKVSPEDYFMLSPYLRHAF